MISGTTPHRTLLVLITGRITALVVKAIVIIVIIAIIVIIVIKAIIVIIVIDIHDNRNNVGSGVV